MTLTKPRSLFTIVASEQIVNMAMSKTIGTPFLMVTMRKTMSTTFHLQTNRRCQRQDKIMLTNQVEEAATTRFEKYPCMKMKLAKVNKMN